MMFKRMTFAILFTAALALATPADAQIMGGVVKDTQVCQNARETGTWTREGLDAAPYYNTCSSNNLIDAASGQQYKGIRVDPGRAAAPIEIYGNCFYIDNYTTSSFFVPANTPNEWASFVQNHPDLIVLTPCCSPDAAVNDTCGGSLTRDNYVRPGYREDHQVGLYGARPVALQCVLTTNGRSAEWDLMADTAVDCDQQVAGNDGQSTGFRVATIQGTALIRNLTND